LTVGESQDLVGRFDPSEGSRLAIPGIEEALDGLAKCRHALEDATVNGPTVEQGEPGLNLVHPAGAGGREMKMNPLVALQPLVDLKVLVGVVVVHHQVRLLSGIGLGQEAKESKEVIDAVTLREVRDDLSGGNVEGATRNRTRVNDGWRR